MNRSFALCCRKTPLCLELFKAYAKKIDERMNVLNQHSHPVSQNKKAHRILRWMERTCIWLPGKARGGIRCVLENGWRYTIRILFFPKRVSEARQPVIALRLNKTARAPRICVSMFSSPARVEEAMHALESLLRQTVAPDRLLLWLAKDAFPAGARALPKALLRLKRHGLTIAWCETARADCGLLPTLAMVPGEIVVTVDDRLRVQPDLIERLYDAYRKNPDMIHCHGALKVVTNPETGEITLREDAAGYPVPSYCNLPLLGLGCLVPPGVLPLDGIAPALPEGDLQVWFRMIAHECKASVVDHPIADADTIAILRQAISVQTLGDLLQTIPNAGAVMARLQNEQREMEYLSRALLTPQTQKDYTYYKNVEPALYRAEVCLWYQSVTQKRLDLDHPKTYNEKLQWMKLYDSTRIKTMLTDKFGMRDWIAKRIGSEYLVPLLGVWNSADEIDFDSLPERFVLKATHGSSWVMVVRDKRTLDIPQTRKKLNSWIAINFAFVTGLELHYRSIVPRIIAEEYLENAEGDLTDYKFWCFEGKVHSLAIVSGRSKASLRMSYYNQQWETIALRDEYPQHEKPIEKPRQLQEMVAFAERLSHGFAHVRVDIYLLNDGQIKLGEFTFTPTSGTCHWSTLEVDRMLGDLFALPEATTLDQNDIAFVT